MIALLFDHLWQSTLFAAAAALLALGLRRNGADVRFWLWFSASVKFLLPFAILTILGSYFLAPITPSLHAPTLMRMQPVAQPFSGLDPTLVLPSSAITPAGPTFDLTFLLLALWAAGFATISIRWIIRWSKLRDLLRAAVDLKVAAPIAVKSSSSRIEPGLVGIFRPVILLPEGIEKQLSPAEMNTILAHELCHWRRRDNLLAAVHMLVEALFWFFPLVWWLGARLNAERERACDESVLAAGGDPAIYAESILKVCRLYLQSPLACAAGVSGAGLKQRMDVIMENRFLVRLNALKKSLLATCAATAIVAPLSLGLLTAPAGQGPALAQTADAPHPGTEAALRHQIESMMKDQPDYSVMVPSLAQAARQQHETGQIDIKKRWGALKSITFRENQNGNDVYLVEFENQLSAWTIGPLQPDGKIGPVFNFGPSVKRDGNDPSPGLEAAVRHELDGDFSGNPALEIMSQGLQNATQNQWKMISETAKALGAVQIVTFQKVNARGWDVYHVTFANGTATVQAAPLADGKLYGIFHSDVMMPHAPQHPGTEAWLRRYIAAIQNGTPNYSEMGLFLANVVRQQWPDQQPLYKSLGALQSLTFEGGGAPIGTDRYIATFKNGKIRWGLEAPDAAGKLDRLIFQKLN
jgi:beta-lactamase regulating signal transducer with metallopeptidase domain